MKLWNKNGERRAKKRLPLLAYLAYLMVATMVFTGVTFSGYISTTTGTDTATVAKFSISKEVTSDTLIDLDLSAATGNKTDSYTFTVTSNSEVRAAYTVTVTLPKTLPTGVAMEMTMSGGAIKDKTASDNVYTYSSELGFTDTHTWTLSFTGDPTKVAAETTLSGIAVSVTAEQID